MGIGTIIGGALGLIGASKSANAVSDASAQSADVQKYIFDQSVALQQPFLDTGYAANNELAALYGLAPPIPGTPSTDPYSQAAGLPPASGDVYGSPQPTNTQGNIAPPGFIPASEVTSINPDNYYNPTTGQTGLSQGEYYNPSTGQVYNPGINYTDAIKDPYAYWNDLWQTGDPYEYVQSIQNLAEFQQSQAQNPTPPPNTGTPGTPGTPGMTSAEQQQAAIDRFYQSPEYTLMYEPALQYGTDQLNQIAAAGGSFQSGAQAQALGAYAGDLASQTYGNYVNQLNAMSGYGQTAAGNTQVAGQNYATGMSNALMAGGQAQAAGYMGMTNSALDAINAYGVPNYGTQYGGMPSGIMPASSPYGAQVGTGYVQPSTSSNLYTDFGF